MAGVQASGSVNGAGQKAGVGGVQSDKAVLIVGALIGFFLIPPLARANPALVNGFLILVLFSTLLLRRDRWLPYLEQFSNAA